MKNIRVLFVTHTVLMAGANSSMLQLIKELKKNYGVKPVVLMPHVHANYAKRNLLITCQEQQIECYSYRFYWFKEQPGWKSWLKCVSNLMWYPRILWKMRGKKYDVIHSNGSVISLGAFLSRVKRVPHVWHLREFADLDFGLKPLLGKKYEKWVYQHGDVFVAISDVIKEHYLSVVKTEKINRIYNGIFPADQSLCSKHVNSQIQFCMIGLLSSPKNQLEALRAVNILVNEWRITTFHLAFVGYEEPIYTQVLYRFVSENHLESFVSFMGEQKDVPALLSKMDVGLMLSNNEAFGRVTVECMMQGLAVIASDSGANTEIVKDGETGFVYHIGDARALASKMRLLIEQRQTLLNMAEKGRERALAKFTSEQNTRNVYETYKRLVEGL